MAVEETRSPLQIVADNRRATVRAVSMTLIAAGTIIVAAIGFLIAHLVH
jgi:hypothetical protein